MDIEFEKAHEEANESFLSLGRFFASHRVTSANCCEPRKDLNRSIYLYVDFGTYFFILFQNAKDNCFTIIISNAIVFIKLYQIIDFIYEFGYNISIFFERCTNEEGSHRDTRRFYHLNACWILFLINGMKTKSKCIQIKMETTNASNYKISQNAISETHCLGSSQIPFVILARIRQCPGISVVSRTSQIA